MENTHILLYSTSTLNVTASLQIQTDIKSPKTLTETKHLGSKKRNSFS